MKTKVLINYKSGNSTTTDLIITAEEIADRIRHNKIDINSETLSMIKWGEVESIVPLRGKNNGSIN